MLEPFQGSNIQWNAVHPPKILSCLLAPHPAKSCTFSGNLPALSEPASDPAPPCVWIDILKEFILNIHRGSFFPPILLRLVNSLWVWVFLHHQGTPCVADIPWDSKGSCKAPAGGMEHMSPTWNALGKALNRRTPTDSQEPQTRSSRLARHSKYVILWGGITSDLPYPRFPSGYFSWSTRQTWQRTSLSCLKSFSKDVESGQKTWWVLGEPTVQDTRGCRCNCRWSVLMSGNLKDGATTCWRE